MRIQFSLSCQKGTVIPINYQSEISNWIFTVLSNSGAEMTAWMHKRGFDPSSKTYKLFTFSPLAIYPYEMDQVRQEFRLMGNQVKLGVSLYLDPTFEQQVVNLFRQFPLELGMCEGKQATFSVKHWQVQQQPNLKEHMRFKIASPLSVTDTTDGILSKQFPSPDNPEYDIHFFTHLVRRFKAGFQYRSLAGLGLLDPSFPMEFRQGGQFKSRLIHLKPNTEGLQQVRGFLYEFDVTMPLPMMEFAYYAGFGENCHLGFGFVDMK